MIAEPHRSVHRLSTDEIWEIGGEFLSIRRKESAQINKQNMDKAEYKRKLVSIEGLADSKWKGRLLSLLEFLGQLVDYGTIPFFDKGETGSTKNTKMITNAHFLSNSSLNPTMGVYN